MSSLTKEQLQRIEENRKKALERKAAASSNTVKAAIVSKPSNVATISSSSFYGTSNFKKPLDVQVVSKSSYSNGSPSAKKLKVDNDRRQPSTSSTFKSSVPHSSEVKLTSNNSGICKLQSEDRFSVNMGYNQQTIEVFKKMPSRQYDMTSRTWSFSIKDHDALIESMRKLQPPVFITPIPAKIRKLLIDAAKPVEEVDLSGLDETCREALMPFQVEGVKFCISKGGRALLADDMGLGKTIQALAVANYYIKDWPLLIVCPSSVRFSWAESFRMWLPSVPLHELVVMTNGKEFIEDARILVVSYDLLTRQKEILKKMKFGMIILDESHSLKNFTAKRSQAVQPLVKFAKRVLLLSGTPALSRPIELYFQLTIISQGGMISIDEFGSRYCAGVKKAWGMDYSGSSNMDELNILLQACFMIRRLKKNVLTQLPGKFRQTIILPKTAISIEKKELKLAKEAMLNVHGAQKHGALLSYYHETSYVKTKAICDYISELLEADKKFICFAHHSVVLDAICDKLIQKKFRYIRIDGETSSISRQEMCQTFQNEERCRAAVLSITAANSGITLTAAHLVVFAELFWNPGIMLQAEDRVHRIGQQNSVVVQYLVAKNTSDDHMWNLLQKKLVVLNKAGLNQDNMTSTSSTRNLADEDQGKITKFFTPSQAVREEEKAVEEDLMLEDFDWDSIEAEAAMQA